ncbi:unnamed protein product [Caenorhabditis brenneri]
MASLPLFRLPLLALEEFVRCLTPVELFILSICSRRAARIVPLSKSSKFEMKLDTIGSIRINDDYCFIARDMPWINETDFKCKTLGCTARTQINGELASYWQDTQHGILELGFYLSKLFHCPIRSITYSPVFHNYTRVKEQETREFIQKVSRRQNGIDCVQIWENGKFSPFKWY